MKITAKAKRHNAIILVSILVVLICAGTVYVLLLKGKTNYYETTGDTSQKDTTIKNSSIPNTTDSKPDTPANPPTTSNTTDPSTTTNNVPMPSTNETYPVNTEHYKISQIDSTTYSIALYAINNTPAQYDEYMSQLKQYKKEALSYLSTRYGSVSGFKFIWSPPNAEGL